MVIEYIKRNQKMGYEGDKLVYKVPQTEEVPLADTTVEEEVADVVEEPKSTPTFGGLFG